MVEAEFWLKGILSSEVQPQGGLAFPLISALADVPSTVKQAHQQRWGVRIVRDNDLGTVRQFAKEADVVRQWFACESDHGENW